MPYNLVLIPGVEIDDFIYIYISKLLPTGSWLKSLSPQIITICVCVCVCVCTRVLMRASQMAQWQLPMQETQMWVPSLSWEDPLKEEMATCSSILA